jgi:hypothetical protein
VLAVAAAVNLVLTGFAAWWTETDPVAITFGFLHVANFAVNRSLGYVDLFGVAAHLGLPSLVPDAAALSLAAAGLYLAGRTTRKDEALLLSATSILALTLFYHFSYDCIVLIFPLVYVADLVERGNLLGPDRAFALPVLATVIMTWYLERLIEGSASSAVFDRPSYRVFYWILIVVSYTALGGGLYRLWRAASAPMAKSPAAPT